MPLAFSIARLPRIEFGPGSLRLAPGLASLHGRRALLVTGGGSFLNGPHWEPLAQGLRDQGISWEMVAVAGEPSPALVDAAVVAHRGGNFDCVLGIGGGSALDAAKAIAGLLRPGHSVMDHLEGVGPERPYSGPATPFIAIPTTAGTGSEATKNAVLSVQGRGGFKKSFRDDQLMAECAILDPDLLATCPASVIAANGMDAFTQLLESYVSTRATPFMDALALSGMERVRDALLPWIEGEGDLARHRANMAYAALLSGITLAHVGLGSVHGLASPIGAFFPIPHGVVCGCLVAEATRVNIAAMQARDPANPSLSRYAVVGRLLAGARLEDHVALDALVRTLNEWTRRLQLPRLGVYGVTSDDVGRIVAHCRGASMKTNPVVLSDAEVSELVAVRL